MNDNNKQMRLIMSLFAKFLFQKKNWIQLSCRLKNYMPEICLNVQKVDYQRAEGSSFFQILNAFGHWS